MNFSMIRRPRRNRKSDGLRRMVRENVVLPEDLIAPLFVIEGSGQSIPVKSMPGVNRLSIDNLVKECRELYDLGIPCVSLFPAIEEKFKTKNAKEAYNPGGLNQRAIAAVKEALPEMVVMSDVALDPYSSLGHDGLVNEKNYEILNDETLPILAKMAIVQANAGSDIVGPSDMMDGRVLAIREALDMEGFINTSIMAYTAKYASAFYGPFRDALDSTPKKGDKKTYQMDFANANEALLEADIDEEEGADILMVKPGLAYLDILRDMRENTDLPVAVYNVSGEYAMVKAAHEKGWIDGEKVMVETLYAFKRAGANIILTYFAKDMAKLINS